MPWLIAFVTAAAALRVLTADYSLWFDDLAALFFSSQTQQTLWSDWMVRETNPPLFYSLLNLWIHIFGLSELSARMLSIVASLSLLILAFFGTRLAYGIRAAIVAATLLTVSAQQLVFAQQVRSYIFLMLFVAVSYFGILAILREQGRALRGWCLYVVGAVAGIYCHTTGVIWPVAASLALVCVDRRYLPIVGKRWRSLVIANAIVLLASSWWLWITMLQLQGRADNIGWITWPGFENLPQVFLAGVFLARGSEGWQLIPASCIAGLAVLGAIRTWSDRQTRFTAAVFLAATAAFIVISLYKPIILDRTILWISLFPLILASAAFSSLRGAAVRVALLGGAAALLAWDLATAIPRLEREDWRLPVASVKHDHSAVLLVDGEAMGAAMTMACRLRLSREHCPFHIAVLDLPDKRMDTWARGYASADLLHAEDRSSISQVYMFSRWGHDPLDDMHQQGLLRQVQNTPSSFVGPLDGAVFDTIRCWWPVRQGVIEITAVKATGCVGDGETGSGLPAARH